MTVLLRHWAVLTLLLVPLAPANAGDGAVTFVPSGPEQAAQGPYGVFASPDQQWVIVDQVDAELISASAGRDARVATEVVALTAETAAYIRELIPEAVVAERTSDAEWVVSVSEDLFTVQSSSGARAASDVELESISGEPIVRAEVLSSLDSGGVLVSWEELQSDTTMFYTRSFVGRFDGGGTLVSVGEVPLAEMPYIAPHYVAGNRRGEVVFVDVSQDGEVTLERLPMSQQRPLRNVEPPETDDAEDPLRRFQRHLRRLSAGETGGRAVPRTRQEVVETAQSYLNLDWQLAPANYSEATIESRCAPGDSNWLRPKRLDSLESKLVRAMPYRWGGYATPERFMDRLAKGSLAGDVCTCPQKEHGYCIVEQATGVDCSGFVSSVWGIRHTVTAYLEEVTEAVRLADLKPGDALNSVKRRHVRLFLGFESTANGTRYRVIESSIQCGGVCERTYSASELRDYRGIRYPDIEDE